MRNNMEMCDKKVHPGQESLDLGLGSKEAGVTVAVTGADSSGASRPRWDR